MMALYDARHAGTQARRHAGTQARPPFASPGRRRPTLATFSAFRELVGQLDPAVAALIGIRTPNASPHLLHQFRPRHSRIGIAWGRPVPDAAPAPQAQD
jgi:hypothetical protein